MAAKVAVFFCFLAVSLLLPLTAFADPDPSCTYASKESLCTFCLNGTGKVTPPFKNNLRNLLQSLPTNTSLTGFYNGSLGSDPSSEVYVQALCRGDVGPSVCKDCVENASREILKECQTMEAIIWYQLCQVHYSHLAFFSSMVYTGKYPPYNNEKQSVNNGHKFYLVLEDLFDKLSNQAANDSSRQMFAVGRAKVSHTKAYGLVECTRDISANDCATCLQEALGDLKGCCFSHDGGMVLSRNCDVRFETSRFYNLSAVYDEDRGESGLMSALAIPQGVGITEEANIEDKCLYRIEAVVWFDECVFRYSNVSFFGKLSGSAILNLSNTHDITNVNVTGFTQVVNNTLNLIAARAANGDQLGRKFAIQEVNVSSSMTLYALGQCTPDLTTSDCRFCLTACIDGVLNISYGKQGGRMLYGTNCNIRYEIYSFFDQTVVAAAAPAPSG
ncbi:hypothetical protein Ancab_004983, partial [Ancistrocladus abbreviatus]